MTIVKPDGSTNVMQMPAYLRDLVFHSDRVDGDKTRLDEGTWEQLCDWASLELKKAVLEGKPLDKALTHILIQTAAWSAANARKSP